MRLMSITGDERTIEWGGKDTGAAVGYCRPPAEKRMMAEACGNRTHLARVRRHAGFEDQESHQAQSASNRPRCETIDHQDANPSARRTPDSVGEADEALA